MRVPFAQLNFLQDFLGDTRIGCEQQGFCQPGLQTGEALLAEKQVDEMLGRVFSAEFWTGDALDALLVPSRMRAPLLSCVMSPRAFITIAAEPTAASTACCCSSCSACFLAALLPQKVPRGSERGAQLQVLQGGDRGAAMPNARKPIRRGFRRPRKKWEGYHACNLLIQCHGAGRDSRYAVRFQRFAAKTVLRGLTFQRTSPGGVSAHPGKAHGVVSRLAKAP